MVTWNRLTVGALVAATAGSAVVAGVILTAGGPLADQGSDDDGTQKTDITLAVQTFASGTASAKTSSANQTPPATGTPDVDRASYPPDERFGWEDQFDFDRLPAVDTSSWRELVAPNGTLAVRVPPGWDVQIAAGRDLAGNSVGDTLTIQNRRIVGDSLLRPGSIKLDAATTPFEVPFEAGGASLRTLELRPSAGRTIRVFQYPPDVQFARLDGVLTMLLSERGDSGFYVSLAAALHFDMTAADVATAVAIITSIEVQ